MFKINDHVLYSGHGVCRIADISARTMGGQKMEYYVLNPVKNHHTVVYVPTQNENTKMRLVLSATEAFSLLKSMPGDETEWIENDAVRKEHSKQILANGESTDLFRLIRTIYLHQQVLLKNGKKLHMSDENCLKEAEKMLHDELAFIFKIDYDQVVPFIAGYIETDEKSSAKNCIN